jgi:hypothetical protein
MTRQALKVAIDGTVTDLDLDAPEGSLQVLQNAVDGYIERVGFRGYEMYVNEDGKSDHLELNSVATMIFHQEIGPGDVIVGDVVFTGEVDRYGELTGISEKDAESIREWASIAHLI